MSDVENSAGAPQTDEAAGVAPVAAPAPASGNFIGAAWLVIALALLYGGGLAAVQVSLGGRIAENRRNETYSVIPSLVPGAVREETEEILVTGANGKQTVAYKAFAAGGTHVGWVLKGGGQGFADRIDLLIGVDAGVARITGMYVLAQKETPGLGDYITGEAFRAQYGDKPAARPLVVVKEAPQETNQIQALTGATISSVAVTDIVNATIANLKAAIGTEAGDKAPPAAEPAASEPADAAGDATGEAAEAAASRET
jgi:electron transport complex protein RnfG